MLRNVLARLSQALKRIKMSEILPSTTTSSKLESNQGAKRNMEPAADQTDSGAVSKKTKTEDDVVRRKKAAMFIAYCGSGYYGIQINRGFPTIESEIMEALVKAGLILQEHSDDMSKIQFQRAARTDKGVSAMGQVLSLKLPLDVENIVEKINEHLPEKIRVLAVKRATKGFNSKNWCCARTYAYMLPTYAFAPLEKLVREDYRVTDEILAEVNKVLLMFKGTHNFHNFTSGVKPHEATAKRHMLSLECSPQFIRNNAEYTIITVKGQSFMLHHIRKMIGLTIAVIRGLTNVETIDRSFGDERLDIPKAPGLGLSLEKLHYDNYNKRYSRDGIHEALDSAEFQEVIDKFKEDYIIPNVIKGEQEDHSMLNWMATLHHHNYDVRVEGSSDSPVWRAHRKIYHLEKELEAQASSAPVLAGNGQLETPDDAASIGTETQDPVTETVSIERSISSNDRAPSLKLDDTMLSHVENNIISVSNPEISLDIKKISQAVDGLSPSALVDPSLSTDQSDVTTVPTDRNDCSSTGITDSADINVSSAGNRQSSTHSDNKAT